MEFKNNLTAILILSGTILILLFSSDPILFSDSNRYLSGSIKDPPLYSSIIFMMQSVFKSLSSIVILQTCFVGFGIYYFTKTIEKKFKLDKFTTTITALFLFLPFIEFYRNILTEPLGYGLSLLFVSFASKLIENFNNRNIFYFSIFVILLLLTRNQFIFLYPLILLFYLGIFFLNKSKKIIFTLLISFLCIFFIHNAFISLNNYLKKNDIKLNDVLSNDSGIYYYLYIDAIYISDVNDSKLIKNQKLSETINKILNQVDNKKASKIYYDGRGHFGSSFSIIRDISKKFLVDFSIKENTSVIEIKKEIAIELIKKNFTSYMKLVFKKLYDSTWLFVFLPFFMAFSSLTKFIKYRSYLPLFILFLSTYTLGNHSVVYLFGRVQPRYLVYTDFILLIFIFIIFTILFQKKNKY